MYDTSVYEVEISSRIPVIDTAKKIEKDAHGGGTNTSLVFAYALDKGRKYERIIIISDNESWQDSTSDWFGNRSAGCKVAYTNYKVALGVDPWVYAIDIQGYGTKDIAGERVINLAGWSERLLDLVGLYEKGTNMVDYIKSIVLE
jgi:hypothetical protein